ncbi:MAG TPA: hypothetical protein VF444_17295 [Pseudonocardiaceae bacterium]
MTRPATVRFLRSEPTMAYPRGRILAVSEGRYHVLANDGWVRLGQHRPTSAERLTREEAAKLCEATDLDARYLDAVPTE